MKLFKRFFHKHLWLNLPFLVEGKEGCAYCDAIRDKDGEQS